MDIKIYIKGKPDDFFFNFFFWYCKIKKTARLPGYYHGNAYYLKDTPGSCGCKLSVLPTVDHLNLLKNQSKQAIFKCTMNLHCMRGNLLT